MPWGIPESPLSPILFSSPAVSYSILCRLHFLCRFPRGRDHPDLHADLRDGMEIAYRPIQEAVENVSSRGLYRGEAVVSEKKSRFRVFVASLLLVDIPFRRNSVALCWGTCKLVVDGELEIKD